MNEITLIADEPYIADELMFKADPEEYMWHEEMANYVENNYVEDWR